MKKRIKYLVVVCFILGIVILSANKVIKNNASTKIYTSSTKIPKNRVGVVLGTAKYLLNGNVNLYYKYRLAAAIDLFKEGKVENIIVSGDNSTETYDEPTAFKEDLMKAGVPENHIFLDYAGFRTLDSMVRAKAIFGQEKFTIISQKFHNERAIFLAEHFNIEAIAYNAKDVSGRYGLRVTVREYLARVKVFVDIIFNVQPKFLGEKIKI